MKLSDIGLPPEEVDKIISDIEQAAGVARQPEPPKSVEGPKPDQPIIRANDVTPIKDNTKSTDVGTSLLPPAVVPPGMKPPSASQKPGVVAYLAAAGAGFLVGGPIGAAVGAGAVALLGGKSAPKPPLPVKAPAPATPAAAVAAAQPMPVKVAQVTPTSVPAQPVAQPAPRPVTQPAPAPVAQPAKSPVADRTISMTSRTAGAALASRLKLP